MNNPTRRNFHLRTTFFFYLKIHTKTSKVKSKHNIHNRKKNDRAHLRTSDEIMCTTTKFLDSNSKKKKTDGMT